MTTAAELTGPLAAFLAGMVTSLHCVGMCGPLACTACTRSGGGGSRRAMGVYHAARVLSYGVVGIVAGLVGRRFADELSGGATRAAAWVFALFFLAVVLGVDKRLRLPVSHRVVEWLRGITTSWGAVGRSGALGACTPLLPCAPLYVAVAAAALAGSAVAGGTIMVAFALGTIPLLFVLQSQFHRLAGHWSPAQLDMARRMLALASVVVLVLRGTYEASTGCVMGH